MPTSLASKHVLLTGGTAGLGALTVERLAALSPAGITFTGRNVQAASRILASLTPKFPAVKFHFLRLDLASLSDVRSAVRAFLQGPDAPPQLDLLVANAGIMATPPALSTDGYEVQFATNHLGHALLVKLLLPLLREAGRRTGDARVVVVTSLGYQIAVPGGIAFDRLRDADAFGGVPFFGKWMRYGQSKLANVLYAAQLAEREAGRGRVSAVSIHPGIIATDLVGTLALADRMFVYATSWWKMVGPEEGVLNSVWASTAGKGEFANGGFFEPVGKPGSMTKSALNAELGRRLWEWTEEALSEYSL